MLDVFGTWISSAAKGIARWLSGWPAVPSPSGWTLALAVPARSPAVPPYGFAMTMAGTGAGTGTGGDPAATVAESVSELYLKYNRAIYWVCLRYMRNSEDAEDMLHQVFMKVNGNLAGFRGQSNVYSWMYRIAVNECIQVIRKRKFEVDGGALPDLENMIQVAPESEMDAKLVLERILKATDKETAEILFMLHLEGLSQDEVAEALDMSRSTLNRKLSAFKAKIGRLQW